MDDVFRAEKADYAPKLYTRDAESMLGLVASDMGIAIVSAIVKSIFQAGLTVVPLKPFRWIENLCLTWRRDRARSRDSVVPRARRERRTKILGRLQMRRSTRRPAFVYEANKILDI